MPAIFLVPIYRVRVSDADDNEESQEEDEDEWVKISKRLSSTPQHLLGKKDICRSGTRIVKGASHRLSKVLRTHYKDVIAIMTDLKAHSINQDTKLLLDSIEKTIRIVKRFRKRIKDLSFDHTWVTQVVSNGVFRSGEALLLRENDSYTYYPSEYEKRIYIEIYNSTQASEEKLSIKVEHPIVSIIGNYAINAFNGAFEQHVKNGEHNRLRHFEFLECKFLKFVCGHHFDMTIEAFEEGYIGTYRTEVIWNIDFCAITVHISVEIKCTGPQRGIAEVEIDRIRRLQDKTIEGLKRRQYQDIKLLFPSDCYRPTKRDRCSHPVASSVMMRRKKDTATYGYDFYNPNFITAAKETGTYCYNRRISTCLAQAQGKKLNACKGARAGKETKCLSKTETTGVRRKEGSHINKSLLTLGMSTLISMMWFKHRCKRKLGFGLVSTTGVDYEIHVANHLGLSSVGKDPVRFPWEKINKQGYRMEFEEDPALVDLDRVVELTCLADLGTVWLSAL
ncbi:hypothetical protein Tco_0905161 [Tanacetum coccineum]